MRVRSNRWRMIYPSRRKQVLSVALTGLIALTARAADKPGPPPSGPQADGAFRKVVLEADRDVDGDGVVDDVVVDPMEIAVAPDGRVFFIERAGILKCWDPRTKATTVAAKLPVFTGLEDGLIGLALDPKFAVNHWVYLFYSEAETRQDPAKGKVGENRVARFTLRGDTLDLASEKILLRVATQREDCCHSAGSLAFDAQGNLYAATGDNTHPGASDGYIRWTNATVAGRGTR